MTSDKAIERRVRRAIGWRILVLLFLLYAFFSIDRGNIGFASLEMNSALGLSGSIYGTGAGLFTLAYLIFQVPAAITMRRLGAARGFAAVAIGWGITSMLTAFVWSSASFLAQRALLGFAEAGFGAFVVYYISIIIPRNMRGLALSITLSAVPVTMIVASPLSGFLLDFSKSGLYGWQWLFLVEGASAVLLGFLCLRALPDRAEEAMFLNPDERAWLVDDIKQAPAAQGHHAEIHTLLGTLASPTVWVLGLVLFAIVLGTNTLLFWMPQIMKQISSGSNVRIGWLNAVPWLTFTIGMILTGRLADSMTNKLAILSMAMISAACGFAMGASVHSTICAFLGLLVGAAGIGASIGLFWTVPMQFLRGAGVAGAFAAINMIGNSSGVFAHAIIGWLHDKAGNFGPALFALAGTFAVAVAALNIFTWLEGMGGQVAVGTAEQRLK